MRFSVGLWIFGPGIDRFVTAGYREPTSIEEKIELAAGVKDVEGVEIHYPSDFKEEDIGRLKDLLKENNLKVATVNVDLFSGAKWKYGSFSVRDERKRSEAIEITKKAMDSAKAFGTDRFGMWLGQDGYDYPFQVDYRAAWDRLVRAVRECGEYKPELKVALEYKIKEPRTHSFLGTVGKTLLFAEEVGLDNVGVLIDVGHALMAFENPAESVALLMRHNKLFHLHFNDNYRDWDHDMIAGTVNFWDLVEMIFWLQELGYDGWYGLDIFPYREDPRKACEQSIQSIKIAMKFVQKLGAKKLRRLVEEGDITKTIPILYQTLL